ncbi:MAG: tetratricopeptide repeat protein [Rhizomicrobium sp.]
MQNGEANAVDGVAAEAAAVEAAPPSDAPPRQRLVRRGELAQLLDAKLVEDTELKDAPRAPDAWLERRLRVFERQMTAMESRQEQVEKNARAAAAAAEETIKALQATVAELKGRADAAEAKVKTVAAELRASLNEAVLRVETVESVARAALAENHGAEAEVPAAVEAAPVETPPEEPAPSQDEAKPADEPGAPGEAPKSYLTEVRKSVAAATAAAEAEAAAKAEKKSARVRFGLTRYFLGSVIVLTIFAAGAGVAFSKGLSDGRRDAIVHRAAAPARVALAVAPATPLDRLTARAEAGDAVAELTVGLRYLGGKDPAQAFHWITLAAIHGQPVAQYRLALLYANGTGTARDEAHALYWYEASALQGNRKAMHDLAIAYAQGRGTAKNSAEAARWFSRAAGFGYIDSEFDLAVLYERGEGVPQSLLDAYKWYAVAGRQGDAESKTRLEALQTQLSADDLAAARHAAEAFKAAPYDRDANVLDL